MANALKTLTETAQPTSTQSTTFGRDAIPRYVCNTLLEAKCSADPNPCLDRPEFRAEARPFDFIIIGGGTFGAALAEHLAFRTQGRAHRILVLEGGPFLVPEHVQNLPMIGLDVASATTINELRQQNNFGIDKPRNEVWGLPWQSGLRFPGLAYCLGGRSLYWGGWSPELLDVELPASWPVAVINELRPLTLPNGQKGYFRQASELIGTSETNDFVFGDLHRALRQQLFDHVKDVTDVLLPGALPDHPAVRYSAGPIPSAQLAALLGLDPAGPLPPDVTMKDQLKLEAPLAVQGRSGHAGFFPINKFSSGPLLIKAAREAFTASGGDDVKRPLMIVPNCHVNRIQLAPEGARWRAVSVETNQGSIAVPADGRVIIALGTIESTRLALASFSDLPAPAYQRIGQNLMAHLRSNIDVRIPRAALVGLPASVKDLETSALFIKGEHAFNGGGIGHFHLQITASGLGAGGTDSEAELFKKVPDIDKFAPHLHADDIAWYSWLYPAEGERSTGSIRGRVLLPDRATGLRGINVIARQAGDPLVTAVASVTGALWNGRAGGRLEPGRLGEFLIPGLPPGAYTVELQELEEEPEIRVLPGALPGGPKFWREGSAAQDPPLASTTVRVRSTSASFRWTRKRAPCSSCPHSSRTTSSGIAISAPNFCAWLKARAMSAMPLMPVGKPR